MGSASEGQPGVNHGWSGYRRGCRCEPCRRANTRRLKEYRLRGPQGLDPEPVRAHVRMLLDSGMSQPYLAKVSGVSVSSINRLIYPGLYSRRVLPRVANALMAVQVVPAPTVLVSGIPARRRIHALACMGWTHSHVAARSGVSDSVIQALSSGRRSRVTRQTHEKIAAVYEELSMVFGPERRSRLLATRKRWIPPLGWNDIDDLREKPKWYRTVHVSVRSRFRKSEEAKGS